MLEPGLISETRKRPAPEMDDERRSYYRITPLGKAVAKAEAGRLASFAQDGAFLRRGSEDNLMNFYRVATASLSLVVSRRVRRRDERDLRPANCATQAASRRDAACWLAAICRDTVERGRWCIGKSPGGTCVHSLRSLLRSPGFTITAILLVTIGIGANVAVFTLADFVLVRPLPFPEPDRLVKVWEKHPGLLQDGTIAGKLSRHQCVQRLRSPRWQLTPTIR